MKSTLYFVSAREGISQKNGKPYSFATFYKPTQSQNGKPYFKEVSMGGENVVALTSALSLMDLVEVTCSVELGSNRATLVSVDKIVSKGNIKVS